MTNARPKASATGTLKSGDKSRLTSTKAFVPRKAAMSIVTAPSEKTVVAKPTKRLMPSERGRDGRARSARHGASVKCVPPSAGQ